MTNILKDIWDDRQRHVSWLPQNIFSKHNFDLPDLDSTKHNKNFAAGLHELVGVAHGHLQNAFDYTLLIPRHEAGIRQFCLWALGLAAQTLQNIQSTPHFTHKKQVKVTRQNVKSTILKAKLFYRSNALLKRWFRDLGKNLPLIHIDKNWQPVDATSRNTFS